MVWLFAAVVFVTVAWLLFVSEGFRKFAIFAVLAAVAIGVWVYLDNQAKERLALTSIRPDEIQLTDLTLYRDFSWRLKGTVKNRSASKALSSLVVNIKVSDCRTRPCEIIADEDAYVSEHVPAGQTRFFDAYPGLLHDQVLPDRWEWSYEVKEIRAASN